MMEKRSESERWGVEVLVDEFPGTPAIICGHSVNAALRRKGPTALHEKGQRSNHKSHAFAVYYGVSAPRAAES